MSLAEELERLARLHAEGSLTSEEFASAKSRLLSAPRFTGYPAWRIRRQSARIVFGLPLWAVAVGPDWERGELRGHARGIFALGDMATGWVALGGLSRGIVALGGVAVGFFALGGAAFGGIAIGGGAVGLIAVGGGAFGYYALGGAAAGAHTISGLGADPEAVEFFGRYFPRLTNLLHR